MPIYEYRCRACGHELEALQSLSEAPLTECPACRAEDLYKKVSAAGFRLKGGGWYETDFKQDGKRNLAGDGAGADKGKPDGGKTAEAAKPAAEGGAKTESKTESKTEKPKAKPEPAAAAAN